MNICIKKHTSWAEKDTECMRKIGACNISDTDMSWTQGETEFEMRNDRFPYFRIYVEKQVQKLRGIGST